MRWRQVHCFKRMWTMSHGGQSGKTETLAVQHIKPSHVEVQQMLQTEAQPAFPCTQLVKTPWPGMIAFKTSSKPMKTLQE
ncbi:Hypp9434 [Branchiostoma lanceolatum]|uniref:Hypp9434 protein n=1 Tax=Branchiostoma lanceolatum TaxID=7740 RepID=A0A8S4MNA8_BRALA|nr:Hypp9434 [Branchiostoma lanceolatum]